MNVGGPDMAPHTPRRRHAPAQPWRASERAHSDSEGQR